MNTVRTLICITFALLIGALVHSYSYKKGDPKDKTLAELKEDLEKAKLQNQIKLEEAGANPIDLSQFPPTPVVVTPPAEIPQVPVEPAVNVPAPPENEMLAENERLAAENKKLKKKQSLQKAENDMLHKEAGAIQKELLTRSKPEEARAAEIAQALVMARVKEFQEKSGIIVLDLVRAQNVQVNQVMGIRRGTAGGIIGRIKIANIQDNKIAFADVIPESYFGNPVSVKVGDEIITIP